MVLFLKCRVLKLNFEVISTCREDEKLPYIFSFTHEYINFIYPNPDSPVNFLLHLFFIYQLSISICLPSFPHLSLFLLPYLPSHTFFRKHWRGTEFLKTSVCTFPKNKIFIYMTLEYLSRPRNLTLMLLAIEVC